MNEEKYSTDWWLWRMYREVAEYVSCPSAEAELRLRSLIGEYRNFCEQKQLGLLDPHQRAVDFG